jgi:hypothetical protein
MGRAPTRFTNPQRALLESPYRLTVWWGSNGIGKSMGIAEYVCRAIAGRLPWQKSGPQTVILAGNTWSQLGSTLKYLWSTEACGWFKPGVRYEDGGLKGQRLAVYEVVSGPGAGGELRCGTFKAQNLAGPRADVVVTDEPLPQAVHNELWPRLLGRNGRMVQTFTPTLGTSTKLDYLWDLVDDESKPWAGQIQTRLSLDAVTPRGGLVEHPWMSEEEIQQFEEGLSKIEADMRMGRTRSPRLDSAYFSAWGPHLLSTEGPPLHTPVGIGIDHGSKPGAQRAVLVAVGGRGIQSKVWVIDEYRGDGRTESEQDAAGILSMLARHHMTVSDVDLWVGDRAHHGDRRGGKKSNERLKSAVAKQLGHDISRRGWAEKLPKSLRYMPTPRKYDRSVWEGCEIIHRLMVGERPRFLMHPRCTVLASDLSAWQGSSSDPHKDGIDALRYTVVPMVEGKRR